jgi:class 3 adenylate cyclase
MALFMDRHSTEGLTADDVARAHARDLEVQDRFGVRFTTYFFDEQAGVTCCLVQSPTRDAVVAAHTAAHGVPPDELIEVNPRDIERFFGQPGGLGGGDDAAGSGFRVIVFTDIVGSTSNVATKGDVAAMEIVLAHDRLVREHASQCGGREIDHSGDGLMLSFDSVGDALTCAIDMQRSVEALPRDDPRSFRIRIGVAAGEPVARDQRLFGVAVNLAARLVGMAGPGEIMAAAGVREIAAGKGFTFVDQGDFELKGFAEPVRGYAVEPAARS